MRPGIKTRHRDQSPPGNGSCFLNLGIGECTLNTFVMLLSCMYEGFYFL